MINIVKYTKPKNSSTNSIISSVGAVTSNNNASVTVDTALSPTSINAVQNKAIYKALQGLINTIENTDDTLNINRSGDTVTINSNTWKIDSNGHLKYLGDIDVSGITANNADITDATIENLTVTKAAHFFQLIIDEIKSTKGQILITAANAKLDKVEETTDNYKCYWKTTDGNKKIYNQFAVDDQVICQTFNTLLDGNTNLVNDSTFTNLTNWSASDTYQPLDNSNVTVEDGEVSFISENNTCYLAQRLNLSPSTEYTIKFDMKQDEASFSNVSFIFHSPIIDTTKPYFTNGDGFINNQTLNGIDANIGTEYKTFYITFTTLPTLPSICNMEFVCTNVETENVTTYIRNVELVAASKNKYYWNKVVGVGQSLIDGETYNYIEVSKTDKDSNSNGVPEVGDEIAQLGNRSDTDRQAAIIISAYNNQFLDSALQAPSIVQYNGINDYNLSTHRLNVISKGLNQFKGNFSTTAGDIQTQINNNKKTYFPILKPWYDYENNLITDYKNDPIRYNGDSDIYSTPTFLEPGTYKVRIFVNTPSLGSSYAICYHGNQYPNDLGSYDPIEGFTLRSTGRNILAKDGTTLYEYAGEVTILENGYYGFNWWEEYYMYVPEESNEFESNYSRITQTNNRITSEVGNLSGQVSTIDQKADSIEMKVDETSVRLDNGNFTINADTLVNGNLTIKNAQEGFILNGQNGNTYIVGDSIGTFEQFKSRTYVTNYYNSTTTSSSDSTTIRFNSTLDFGQLPINTTLDFINFSCIVRRMDGVPMVLDSWSYQMNILKDGVVVDALSGNGDGQPSMGGTYTTNATIGNYTAEIQWIATTVNATQNPQKSSTIYFQTKVYTSTFNLIGTDGIGSDFGVNKTFYVGDEGTYIRYTDNNILKVSTNGIQKYAGSTLYTQQNKGFATDTCTSKYISEYSPINGCTIRTITALTSNPSSCYLQPNDEMIIFNLNDSTNQTCNIFLGPPSTFLAGRKVYIKKISGWNTKLYVYGDNYSSTSNNIYLPSNGVANNVEIGYDSVLFICTDNVWIEYLCA